MYRQMKKNKEFQNLYPKYKCAKCEGWYHMPYKFCECDKRCPVVQEYINKKEKTMNINGLLIKDSGGKKSVTMTVFVLGAIVVHLKLILSGVTVSGFTMAPFTGGEYAAAIIALGGVYVLRRKDVPPNEEK